MNTFAVGLRTVVTMSIGFEHHRCAFRILGARIVAALPGRNETLDGTGDL